MAEAIKEGNQVTEDNHEQSSLMEPEPEPEPEWTPGEAGKKIFKNVLKNKRNISTLTLKVISGPSSGLCMSITSAFSPAILTIGRAPPAGFILNDSEVSGKQAVVKFNKETQKWEITDLGSLNGTYLNSKAIRHPDVGSRNHGSANALSSGDVITFGNSKVLANIKKNDLANSPSGRAGGKALNLIFNLPSPGIGMASDPLAQRRGGKPLDTEDVSISQYPLPGVEKFGLVGVFDGVGGSGAAKIASKILPENVVKLLSRSGEKENVLSSCDATSILRQAFVLTEDHMKHQEDEGCTATLLLIWSGSNGDLFAQCANLGDSECVMYLDGNQIVMTEVHRVDSVGERSRIAQTGNPLKDGQSHIHGLNLCRVLGASFLKAKDKRFISEPFVSKALHVTKESTAVAVVASDGLWDVLGPNQAVKTALEIKERMRGQGNYAETIAKSLVKEAKKERTKDSTTVVFVDFDNLRTDSSSTFN